MPQILKNENLEIHIDFPNENYNFSRFDWTGKITTVKFKNILVTSIESQDYINEHVLGKGFYNEFGIDNALGFNETEIGDWFHKIGVGLLKKEDSSYLFSNKYKIKPANFKISVKENSVIITCKSDSVNGYSYILKKEIQLHKNNFSITYHLHNTGKKNIITNEYSHNFTSINKDLIGRNYILKFPFELKPNSFTETVNPEQKVEIRKNQIKFNSTPNTPFFFSNLSGNISVNSNWELTNLKNNISISEIGSFKTNKINIWGSKHVISPELFCDIFIKPGDNTKWSRTYNFRTVK
ncbi:hypothetical protein [uncultured Algibacter sp.]|uniref:hypothetical protein n=1 Tax=uncultured Algibacter sp. TaxID=298659 RepID=UPI00263589FC|nr:hypothetical protein [uncultured Algibacter sp.]